jgi:poly(beta-D-mannuronate) lyase
MKWFMLALGLAFSLFSEAEAGSAFIRDAEQFEKYVLRMSPGDTLLLQSGEDEWRDVNLVFEGEGEPGKPIVLAAQRPGQTIFTGQSRLRVLGKHLVVSGLVFRDGSLQGGSVIAIGSGRGETAQDCRLTDTAIINYNPKDRKVNYKWVSVYGVRNRVDHCRFEGQDHTGQSLVVWLGAEPNGHRIDHNYFAGRPELGWNGGETLRIGTSGRSMNNSNTLVEENLFENCDGEAEIISVKSCGNIIRRNLFLSSSGALTLRHGNRNRVEGNWFVGNGKKRAGGVRVIGEDHTIVNNHFEGLTGRGGRSTLSVMHGVSEAPLNSYWQVKRALIAYNTILDCASSFDIGFGAGGRGRTLPPEAVVIRGNLVRSASGKGITVRDEQADVRWSENVWVGESQPGVPGFERRSVQFVQKGVIQVPSTAALLSVGTSPDSIDVDINGGPRSGMRVAGSDVLSEAAVSHAMPTQRSVGPSWRDATH